MLKLLCLFSVLLFVQFVSCTEKYRDVNTVLADYLYSKLKDRNVETRVTVYNKIFSELMQDCYCWACEYAQFCVPKAFAEIKKNLKQLYSYAATPLPGKQDTAIRTQTTLPELRVICKNAGASGAAVCHQIITDSRNRVIAAGKGRCA